MADDEDKDDETLPGFEDIDTIQGEIAFLKRAAFGATNPTKKYNQFTNVIAAMLQIPFADDIAWECPDCGHVTESEEYIRDIKRQMDHLDIDRDEFDSLVGNRRWPFQMVWQLHAADKLNDLIAIYARIAQRLVRDGIIMDKNIDTEEAVEEALDSIMEGEVPDDTPATPSRVRLPKSRSRPKKGGDRAK